jgi:hypothetical protein
MISFQRGSTLSRGGLHEGPATYVRKVAGNKWQARPPKKDGPGRVNLGTFYTETAAIQSVRLYRQGKLHPLPKCVRPNPKGPGFIVLIRDGRLTIPFDVVFPTEKEACAAVREFQLRMDGLFARYLSSARW